MPGMMDTILNLGLNDDAVEGLKARTSNGRFAYDSYRRFIQMFGNVVLEISKDAFEHELDAVKESRHTRLDTDLDETALREVVVRYKQVVKDKAKKDFPQDPRVQLTMARDAVFRSWMNPRAIEYRRIYDIPDHIGTAVNVQMMVFGNTGDRSGTGVGFTRNPATGAKEFYGEFLINAQGEDVVSGVRTPQPIRELEQVMPKAYAQLRQITTRLEKHYKDVQDFEFTIQDERLFMLQTRSGKRTGYAAVVIATDLVAEKLVTPKEAILLVDPEALNQLLAPGFDPAEWKKIPVATKGLPAVARRRQRPGRVLGRSRRRVGRTQGKPVILVRRETVPDDIHGMFVAAGHPHRHRRHDLTRRRGRPPDGQAVDRRRRRAADRRSARRSSSVGGKTVKEGDFISFDGLSGEVKLGKVASKPSEILAGRQQDARREEVGHLPALRASCCRGPTSTARSASAPTPTCQDQAELAYAFGARGIGLCRTEHMFFGEGRIPIVQEMILADNEADRRKALNKLLPLQRDDFYGVFKGMRGEAVTIRTIDPPLHEFLPKREDLMVDVARLETAGKKGKELDEKKKLLARVEQLHEFNPMLGHRGVRLGITYPEITEMQTRAIIEAACRLQKEGSKVGARDHDPAGRAGEGAQGPEGDCRSRRRRGDEGAGRQDQVPGRHHDRGPARRGHRGRDRRRSAVLLVRHQRSHAADLRLLARRRRQVPEDLHRPQDSRPAIRSRRSTPSAWAGWSRWASSAGARRGPISSSASAASTAATRRRSTSSTRSASTTSAPRRTASRSRGWPLRRRRSR